MRVIAGTHGGRLFASPNGHRTHPMSDKMRGALFNMLGDISGETVLDAFSGSGALAFEALSRGASKATLIEIDRQAQRTIAENIASLQFTQRAKLIRANAGSWLSTSDEMFDLVLLDPPYDNLQPGLIERLMARVVSGGYAVISYPPHERILQFTDCEHISHKSYGDSSLSLYRKN